MMCLLVLPLLVVVACSRGDGTEKLPTTLTAQDSGWPRRFAADDDIESLIEKLEKLDTLVRQQQMRLEQQQQQLEKQQRQIATPTLYQANFGWQF